MTSVQSWLLLPSSWCEDEHSYPTPLDQGSEQPLFQPLDQQATSLPSRGERALSRGVCSSYLHGFPRCVTSCTCSEDAPQSAQPQPWVCEAGSRAVACRRLSALCCLEPLLSSHCIKCRCSSSFLGFKVFSKNLITKSLLFSYVDEVRSIRATEIGVLMAFAK